MSDSGTPKRISMLRSRLIDSREDSDDASSTSQRSESSKDGNNLDPGSQAAAAPITSRQRRAAIKLARQGTAETAPADAKGPALPGDFITAPPSAILPSLPGRKRKRS